MNKNELSLKFQSVFESAIDGIILIDCRGIIEEINSSALKLFGYERNEVVGNNVNMLMPNPHHTNHDQYINKYMESRIPHIIGIGREVDGKRKDGSTFPFRLAVNEVTLEKQTLFTGFIHDLTEERKAQEDLKKYVDNLEEIVDQRTKLLQQSKEKLEREIQEKHEAELELIESQKLYQAIAQNFPNGTIAVLNQKLDFLFIEGQGLRDLGFGSEELVGRNYMDVILPDLKEFVGQKLQSVFEGISATFEMELKPNFFRVRAVPLYNNKKDVERILVVESNITQQKNAEKEIYNSLTKEKELNELKSKFVSMASHEFRTPLSTILSSATLVRKYVEVDQTDKIPRHTDRIQNNVRNLTMILNDFLSLEKLENNNIPTEKTIFNLVDCVKEVTEDMQMLKKPNQVIKLNSTLSQSDVQTDRFVIQNILTNLVSNAIKYSKEDGLIEICLHEKQGAVELLVRDNGIGISEEDKKSLFQRFFRASNAGNVQGTGLGLHIVKRYIDLIQGELIFESELNKGSTFGLVFRNG